MESQSDLTSSNLTLHDMLMSSDSSTSSARQIASPPPIQLVNHDRSVQVPEIRPHYNVDDEDSESDDDSAYTYTTDIIHQTKQWEHNLNQLRSLLDFVVIPILGKMLGRRFAHFAWGRIANVIF